MKSLNKKIKKLIHTLLSSATIITSDTGTNIFRAITLRKTMAMKKEKKTDNNEMWLVIENIPPPISPSTMRKNGRI